MKCYIKSRLTFITSGIFDISQEPDGYFVYLDSLFDDISTLTILTVTDIAQGDIAYIPQLNWFGVIRSAKRHETEKKTILSCRHIRYLFDRPITISEYSILSGDDGDLEWAVGGAIYFNYTVQSDPLYQLPYVNISALSYHYLTIGTMLEPDYENGIWQVSEYMLKALRMYRLFSTFRRQQVSRQDHLYIDLEVKTPSNRVVDFSQKTNQILQETYSDSLLSKLSVV